MVVDDEVDVADAYAAQLGSEYDIETVYSGAKAIASLDQNIDVILLDRRMPDVSGDEVLAEIRKRRFDCRVAMVTAVEPDFDIIEMPFDDYVVKPVTSDALREVIERLLRCAEYEDLFRRYYALTTKYVALRESKPSSVLHDSDEFDRLESDLESVRADLDDITDELDETAFKALFADPRMRSSALERQ